MKRRSAKAPIGASSIDTWTPATGRRVVRSDAPVRPYAETWAKGDSCGRRIVSVCASIRSRHQIAPPASTSGTPIISNQVPCPGQVRLHSRSKRKAAAAEAAAGFGCTLMMSLAAPPTHQRLHCSRPCIPAEGVDFLVGTRTTAGKSDLVAYTRGNTPVLTRSKTAQPLRQTGARERERR